LDGIGKGLRRDLLRDPNLSSEARTFLEKPGADPVKMGNGALLNGLHAALAERVRSEKFDQKIERKLLDGLARAIAELKGEGPPIFDGIGDSGGGGGGGFNGPGGENDDEASAKTDDDYRLQIEKVIKRAAIRDCINRTTILFFVSNVINTVGALQVKWQEYAGENAPVSAVLNKETWDRAAQDPLFRHNVAWNALLMVAMGSFSCMKNEDLGKHLITAMTLVASTSGQYLANGRIEWDQTLTDVLFVRFISLRKTRLVFKASDAYKRAGYAGRRIAEGGLQFLSEGAGAFLYPRAVNFSRWLVGKGPEVSNAR